MLLIQFCLDKELELLIPYEYRAGIISTEKMREIANNLLELAETLTDEDIDQMNERDRAEQIAVMEQQRQNFINRPKGRILKSGVVYLIKAENTDRYKIGCTANLKSRLKSLRIKNPYELKLIHAISTFDIEALEETLHGKFAEYRVHSEWFELPKEAVNEFCCYGDETS
jgi:hypothetical protein